jgi:hypothetical protein
VAQRTPPQAAAANQWQLAGLATLLLLLLLLGVQCGQGTGYPHPDLLMLGCP